MKLEEWTKIYLKQRDMIKREILSIEETNKGFLIKTKNNKEKIILVNEELTFDEANMIVCLNTKKNVLRLVNEWEIYTQKEDLVIVFAKPETNDKWLLKPYHHNKISDNKSLKQGLLAMSDAI